MWNIPRTVVILGVASFLTDFSSEMIMPLLPIFLSTVLGAGPAALGVIEGVAESTASILKIVSGLWTDRVSRRKPFIVVGYGLAGVVRPLIGLATVWPVVLSLRFLDRVGKGLRTSPRDALIADVVVPERRGQAFGFHRMMDHAGAVAGPLVAMGLISLAGFSLQSVFLAAALPAALVIVVLVAGVKETTRREVKGSGTGLLRGHFGELGHDFKLLLAAVMLFTLGNSTDTFIVLRLSQQGVSASGIALLWALHHVVKMGATYVGGSLSDRWGRRRMVLSGWVLYAAVYLAFALWESRGAMIALFLIYGLYYGFTEPTERAWVADLAPKHLRGTAMGYYHGAVGFGALPASVIFGLLWQAWGAPVAFAVGAGMALGASILLLRVIEPAR